MICAAQRPAPDRRLHLCGPVTVMRGARSTVARAECTTTELKIIFINKEDAAGHAYDDLDFTNSSRRRRLEHSGRVRPVSQRGLAADLPARPVPAGVRAARILDPSLLPGPVLDRRP